MRVQLVLAVLSIGLLPVTLLADEGAPAQLRHKTITVTWTAQRTVGNTGETNARPQV